ncbi:MAG: hypothetical protein NVS9B2_30170 [Steroidobacteraceae bacterium]
MIDHDHKTTKETQPEHPIFTALHEAALLHAISHASTHGSGPAAERGADLHAQLSRHVHSRTRAAHPEPDPATAPHAEQGAASDAGATIKKLKP